MENEEKLVIRIKSRRMPNSEDWVKGTVVNTNVNGETVGHKYSFEAKVYKENSSLGIYGGSVRDLTILKHIRIKQDIELVKYDGVWDACSQDEETQKVLNTILHYLSDIKNFKD